MSNIFCAKWCIHASKFWIICTGEQGYANTGANLKELQRYLSYQIFRYSISTLLRLKSRNNHLKCLQIVSQYGILFYVYCVWYDGHSIKCDRRRKQIAALVVMLLWRGGPRTQYTGPPSRFTAPRPIGGRWSHCHTLLALRHSAHISGTLLYNKHHNNTHFYIYVVCSLSLTSLSSIFLGPKLVSWPCVTCPAETTPASLSGGGIQDGKIWIIFFEQ